MVICVACDKETRKKLCDDCLESLTRKLGFSSVSDILRIGKIVMDDISKITGFDLTLPSYLFMIDTESDTSKGYHMGYINNEDLDFISDIMINNTENYYSVTFSDTFPYITLNMYAIYSHVKQFITEITVHNVPDHIFMLLVQEIATVTIIHELAHIITHGKCSDIDIHDDWFKAVYIHYLHLAGYNHQRSRNSDVLDHDFISKESYWILRSEQLEDLLRYIHPSSSDCKICELLTNHSQN